MELSEYGNYVRRASAGFEDTLNLNVAYIAMVVIRLLTRTLAKEFPAMESSVVVWS